LVCPGALVIAFVFWHDCVIDARCAAVLGDGREVSRRSLDVFVLLDVLIAGGGPWWDVRL
jgi:hypothetical protein